MASHRNTPQPLGAVMRELIDELGYRKKIDEARAVEMWERLAGPRLHAFVERAWIKDGTLFVKVRSAPWRHQLHLQRRAWRDRLNEELGREIVREVVFR